MFPHCRSPRNGGGLYLRRSLHRVASLHPFGRLSNRLKPWWTTSPSCPYTAFASLNERSSLQEHRAAILLQPCAQQKQKEPYPASPGSPEPTNIRPSPPSKDGKEQKDALHQDAAQRSSFRRTPKVAGRRAGVAFPQTTCSRQHLLPAGGHNNGRWVSGAGSAPLTPQPGFC